MVNRHKEVFADRALKARRLIVVARRRCTHRFRKSASPASSAAPWPSQGMAPIRHHSFSTARADQNEQPYAVSEAFVASRVCLQLASIVVFADGFLARSTHALRVWSICVLYIAR